MKNPLLRWPSIVLAMLSLSIGWGIRGNYGHEFGAMMPGMLCAVAVALFSRREDWRRRVPFFAFFGAIGWAFGGSMSYMPTMSYTQSGHLASQFYGFFVVFAIGFLWSSLGGAGTAYAAVEEREKLTELFKPLCWVLAIWALDYLFLHDLAARYAHLRQAAGFDSGDARQRDPFYWLDSDWLAAAEALLAVCLFDLWDRRFRKIHLLTLYGAAGAVVGLAIHRLLAATGALPSLLSLLVHYQGDPAAADPANMVTNWPQLFFDLGDHMGWIMGLILGLVIYFWKHGEFRWGASLVVHMAGYGYLVFLTGPVLLSNVFKSAGGFRMVPPRSDSWAFVLGALIGLNLYMHRNNLRPVAYVSILSGLLGGLGFMVAQFVKILVWMPGNPVLTRNPDAIRAWAHWRGANWHSILAEQGVGLLYGLAIVLPMALLAARVKPKEDEPRVRRWTEVFSVAFILNLLLYVNLVKDLGDWTAPRAGGFRSVPLMLKAPLMAFWEMSALGWFNLMFLLITLCTVALLVAHLERPLAVIPDSWLGKGQLFYLVFLWAIVIGNFQKAVVSFHEQRLGTEATVFVNALIATFFLLYYARSSAPVTLTAESTYQPLFRRWVWTGVGAMVLATLAFTGITHGVYGDRRDGWGGKNMRFGPEADWRTRPILKHRAHR